MGLVWGHLRTIQLVRNEYLNQQSAAGCLLCEPNRFGQGRVRCVQQEERIGAQKVTILVQPDYNKAWCICLFCWLLGLVNVFVFLGAVIACISMSLIFLKL